MKIRYLIFAIILASLVGSCGNSKYISIGDANSLEKGLRSESIFNGIDKEYMFEFNEAGSKPYKVAVYRLFMMRQGGNIMYFIPTGNTNYDLFVVAYENNHVAYWGYLDDLKKSDDINIQKLGEMVCKKLIEINN